MVTPFEKQDFKEKKSLKIYKSVTFNEKKILKGIWISRNRLREIYTLKKAEIFLPKIVESSFKKYSDKCMWQNRWL